MWKFGSNRWFFYGIQYFFFFFPVGNSDYNKHKFKPLVDKAVIPDRSAILPGLAAEEYRL